MFAFLRYRKSLDGETFPRADETNSLYSVDQDGFYTTMHTDILSEGMFNPYLLENNLLFI